MKHVAAVRVFIASPGDVVEERAIVGQVIEELNHQEAMRNDLVFQVDKWENVAPGLDQRNGPQALIDPFVDGADVLIILFWKTVGRPNGKGRSFTEAEFERARQRQKATGLPVIVPLFKTTPPTDLHSIDALQLRQVLDFRERISSLGLHGKFDPVQEPNGFYRIVYRALSDSIPRLKEKVAAEQVAARVSHTGGTASSSSVGPERRRSPIHQQAGAQLRAWLRESGQRIAVLGPSGIGRFTLAREIAESLAKEENRARVSGGSNARCGSIPPPALPRTDPNGRMGEEVRQVCCYHADLRHQSVCEVLRRWVGDFKADGLRPDLISSYGTVELRQLVYGLFQRNGSQHQIVVIAEGEDGTEDDFSSLIVDAGTASYVLITSSFSRANEFAVAGRMLELARPSMAEVEALWDDMTPRAEASRGNQRQPQRLFELAHRSGGGPALLRLFRQFFAEGDAARSVAGSGANVPGNVGGTSISDEDLVSVLLRRATESGDGRPPNEAEAERRVVYALLQQRLPVWALAALEVLVQLPRNAVFSVALVRWLMRACQEYESIFRVPRVGMRDSMSSTLQESLEETWAKRCHDALACDTKLVDQSEVVKEGAVGRSCADAPTGNFNEATRALAACDREEVHTKEGAREQRCAGCSGDEKAGRGRDTRGRDWRADSIEPHVALHGCLKKSESGPYWRVSEVVRRAIMSELGEAFGRVVVPNDGRLSTLSLALATWILVSECDRCRSKEVHKGTNFALVKFALGTWSDHFDALKSRGGSDRVGNGEGDAAAGSNSGNKTERPVEGEVAASRAAEPTPCLLVSNRALLAAEGRVLLGRTGDASEQRDQLKNVQPQSADDDLFLVAKRIPKLPCVVSLVESYKSMDDYREARATYECIKVLQRVGQKRESTSGPAASAEPDLVVSKLVADLVNWAGALGHYEEAKKLCLSVLGNAGDRRDDCCWSEKEETGSESTRDLKCPETVLGVEVATRLRFLYGGICDRLGDSGTAINVLERAISCASCGRKRAERAIGRIPVAEVEVARPQDGKPSSENQFDWTRHVEEVVRSGTEERLFENKTLEGAEDGVRAILSVQNGKSDLGDASGKEAEVAERPTLSENRRILCAKLLELSALHSECVAKLGWVHARRGEYVLAGKLWEEGLSSIHKLLEVAWYREARTDPWPRRMERLFCSNLGWVHDRQGYESGEYYLWRAARLSGDSLTDCIVATNRGAAAIHRGDYVLAKQFLGAALQTAMEEACVNEISIARENSALVRIRQGAEPSYVTEEMLRTGLREASDMRDPERIEAFLTYMGEFGLVRARFVEAEQHLLVALALCKGHTHPERELLILLHLCTLRRLQGKLCEARSLMNEATSLYEQRRRERQFSYEWLLAALLNESGELALRERDYNSSEFAFLRAREIAERIGSRDMLGAAYAGLGAVSPHFSDGRYADMARKAEEIFGEIGHYRRSPPAE